MLISFSIALLGDLVMLIKSHGEEIMIYCNDNNNSDDDLMSLVKTTNVSAIQAV